MLAFQSALKLQQNIEIQHAFFMHNVFTLCCKHYFQQNFQQNSCENARITIKHADINALNFANAFESLLPSGLNNFECPINSSLNMKNTLSASKNHHQDNSCNIYPLLPHFYIASCGM